MFFYIFLRFDKSVAALAIKPRNIIRTSNLYIHLIFMQ